MLSPWRAIWPHCLYCHHPKSFSIAELDTCRMSQSLRQYSQNDVAVGSCPDSVFMLLFSPALPSAASNWAGIAGHWGILLCKFPEKFYPCHIWTLWNGKELLYWASAAPPPPTHLLPTPPTPWNVWSQQNVFKQFCAARFGETYFKCLSRTFHRKVIV